ncbi:hypothetical protein B0T17DRAFT_501512 [Bombardia bombarda]|uniref:FAD-binding domain-containing protein n=1 Tax=Bombardia bombarda TaxID=252184 RepID=A0AA39TQN1_9PEZI|nr:hypothetical protein B0T17DRAFT_501512 [Bombardia bombarda]
MPQLKVLISGGGIAGNALAFWLSKLGHTVTVVERFPSLRISGLQIDLRGFGIEVLKRMGLDEAFRKHAALEDGMNIVDDAGRRWAYFGANKSGRGVQSFTSEYEIMRGDLTRIIYDVTNKERVRYIFGTTIKSYTELDGVDGAGVEVLFADGNKERFDLLVGADGIGSHVRKMMVLGTDASDTGTEVTNRDDGYVPLKGVYIAYFTIPSEMKAGESYAATSYATTKKRMIMLRRHNPHTIQVYMICETDNPRMRSIRRGDVEEEKKAFAEIFHGAKWRTEEFLKALETNEDWYLERVGLVQLDSWSRNGRVVLVGDAAHCPTASTGMGTSSAMIGAYILAGEIGRHCGRGDDGSRGEQHRVKDGLAMALKAYDDKFQPFMKRVQKGLSRDTGFWWMPVTWWSVLFARLLAAFIAFTRLNIVGEYFLSESVGDWKLPDYEELRI